MTRLDELGPNYTNYHENVSDDSFQEPPAISQSPGSSRANPGWGILRNDGMTEWRN